MTQVTVRPSDQPPYRSRRPSPRGSRLLAMAGTTDPKQIAILYLVTSFAFFMVGGALALLIRADGKYQIVSRTGTRMKTIVDWTVAPQMADPKGVKTSNTLSIRGLQGAVHFFVGEKEVHQMPRAKAGPDGIAGVRVGIWS